MYDEKNKLDKFIFEIWQEKKSVGQLAETLKEMNTEIKEKTAKKWRRGYIGNWFTVLTNVLISRWV